MGAAWPMMTSFANLCRAAKNAACGKRTVQGAARFLAELEPEALRLQRELVADAWRPGRAVTFDIRDPKVRTIIAKPFRDRVVHHALIDVLEPGSMRRCCRARSRAGVATASTVRCGKRSGSCGGMDGS